MSLSSQAHFNHLLAVLPPDELQCLLGDLELIDLKLGQVLCQSGVVCQHVYFPTTAIVSLLYVLEDGACAEIALVGNEGIVGISQFLGGGSTRTDAVVQGAGKSMRLSTHSLKEAFKRCGTVMQVFLRYTQALMTQMTQTAVCNCHHTIDQRLCRWLLRSLDRVDGHTLMMTHEQIGNMLGVRRESITQAAIKLQNAGLIEYGRGNITVLDRAGIENLVCECYSVVSKEYGRLFPTSSIAI